MKTERVLAYCPACGEQNAAEESVMRGGIECTTCGVGFVPETFTPEVLPDPPAAGFLLLDPPAKVVRASSAVRDWAKSVSTVSKLCFVLCLVIIFFTVWVMFSGDGVTATPYLVATGFLMLGLWLQIIAQLMFIRAALEDKP